MLLEGHRQRRQGVDCVIGFVEPHGRRATQELIDGLELVPGGMSDIEVGCCRKWMLLRRLLAARN